MQWWKQHLLVAVRQRSEAAFSNSLIFFNSTPQTLTVVVVVVKCDAAMWIYKLIFGLFLVSCSGKLDGKKKLFVTARIKTTAACSPPHRAGAAGLNAPLRAPNTGYMNNLELFLIMGCNILIAALRDFVLNVWTVLFFLFFFFLCHVSSHLRIHF